MTQQMDPLLALIDAIIDGLGNLIGWVLIGLAGFLIELYRRIRALRSDVDDLERYIVGDTNDPDSPGLLSKVDAVDKDVQEMQAEMREQHRSTDRKLDQLLGNDE